MKFAPITNFICFYFNQLLFNNLYSFCWTILGSLPTIKEAPWTTIIDLFEITKNVFYYWRMSRSYKYIPDIVYAIRPKSVLRIFIQNLLLNIFLSAYESHRKADTLSFFKKIYRKIHRIQLPTCSCICSMKRPSIRRISKTYWKPFQNILLFYTDQMYLQWRYKDTSTFWNEKGIRQGYLYHNAGEYVENIG